jgi:hypothetical protein
MARSGLDEADPAVFASTSLEREWKRACRRAEHLDDVYDSSDEQPASPPSVQNSKPGFTVINLWTDLQPQEPQETKETTFRDPWLQAASQIRGNLEHMQGWIKSKQDEYISLDLPESEASLIQSTVTSFTAATTQEIERLRSMVNNTQATTWPQFQTSIVFYLLDQLKSISNLFTSLTKARKRLAVHRWQHPLESRLWVSSKAMVQRKRPHSTLLQAVENARYVSNDSDMQETKYTAYDSDDIQSHNQPYSKPDKPAAKPTIITPSWEDNSEDVKASLEREAVLLMAKSSNDLDAIQKMEQRMLDITSLLSQFTDLVTVQQEEVWQIYDNTETSKENMRQGQEQLVNAAQRKNNSKHWMARAIFTMGCVLLVFHLLRP